MGVADLNLRALFASLFLFWLLTFNGRMVSGDLFTCEEVYNIYNRDDPCTPSKCSGECGHNDSSEENIDQCVKVEDLEGGDEYEELFYDGSGGPVGDDATGSYEHMVCCCTSASVGGDGGPAGDLASGGGDIESSESDQLACGCFPKKNGDTYICSQAFYHYTEENPCTENKCINDCVNAGDSFGRCLKPNVKVVDPNYGFTNEDGVVQNQGTTEMITCQKSIKDTEANPCTRDKCKNDCKQQNGFSDPGDQCVSPERIMELEEEYEPPQKTYEMADRDSRRAHHKVGQLKDDQLFGDDGGAGDSSNDNGESSSAPYVPMVCCCNPDALLVY